jgi:hypothetical protein
MFRTSTCSILLLAVLVAACNEAPTTLRTAEAAEVSEVRLGADPPGQVVLCHPD